MTARDIQRRLLFDLYRTSTVVPNYTPRRWWECDVWEMTKAGYFREYEIKISRGDFLADREKSRQPGRYDYKTKTWVEQAQNKHALLAARCMDGPAQFWYVVPVTLVAVSEVPEWAGLIEAIDTGRDWPWKVRTRVAKKAPRLHGQKCDPKVEQHARGVCYYRMHALLVGQGSTAELPDYAWTDALEAAPAPAPAPAPEQDACKVGEQT